jgi:DNA-binding Xre family transcriptional regulator
VREISSYYQGSENYGISYLAKIEESTSFLQENGNGILIFKIASKEDLTLSVSVLKSNLKQIKQGVVKPVCIYMVKNKKVEQILHKYGCSELIEPDIKGKTLTFKIEFWAKAIKTYIKKTEISESLKVKQSDSLAQAQKNQHKKSDFRTG